MGFRKLTMSSRLCMNNFFWPHLLSAVWGQVLSCLVEFAKGPSLWEIWVKEIQMFQIVPHFCHVSTFDQLRINHCMITDSWSLIIDRLITHDNRKDNCNVHNFLHRVLHAKRYFSTLKLGARRGCYKSGVPHSRMPPICFPILIFQVGSLWKGEKAWGQRNSGRVEHS